MNKIKMLMEHFTQDFDCALIISSENRRYFTGFKSSEGILIVTKDEAYFIVDFRYYEKAKLNCKECAVLLLDHKQNQIQQIFLKHNVKRVAVESKYMNLHRYISYKKKYPEFEWLDTVSLDNVLEQLRMIKTQEEIQYIQAAQGLADAAFSHIIEYIKEGKTEREIALELEYTMLQNGAEAISFDTIAVSGKNSSLPHGVPTDKAVQKGDFITMDFGAVVNGYHSDMTRTVALGDVSKNQQYVYNTVLQAQEMALDAILPDKECSTIDAVARDYINNAGFQGKFGHGLGHGVGIEIHEYPSFSPHCQTRLKPGMVLTVEPGIYIENTFGVRIEDMIVVTETGCKNITKSPKQLIIL